MLEQMSINGGTLVKRSDDFFAHHENSWLTIQGQRGHVLAGNVFVSIGAARCCTRVVVYVAVACIAVQTLTPPC